MENWEASLSHIHRCSAGGQIWGLASQAEGVIDIEALLARNDGLILARDHRPLKSSLSRWVKQGKLVRLMRGVYAHPGRRLRDRIRAVEARIPGGIVSGRTALGLVLHPGQNIGVIEVCTPTRRLAQKGYRFVHRPVPRDHASAGVMLPALAAVDASDQDPSWLDELVRRRMATATQFRGLLGEFPHRRGNRQRRRHIARSSTRPWSPAERHYHELFDQHGIKGWVANEILRLGDATYVPDVMFKAERLVIEIDGREFHSDRVAFESDRKRQNELVKAGWTVLRFTWAMLDEPEWVIETIRTVRARLRRARRLAPVRA